MTCAAKQGHVVIVRDLLSAGADTYKMDIRGWDFLDVCHFQRSCGGSTDPTVGLS